MTVDLAYVVIDAANPVGLATFWATLLDREIVDAPYGPVAQGVPGQLGLAFTHRPGGPSDPHRTPHLHLTSSSREDMDAVVTAVLRLGGSHLDVGQLPGEPHVVLADPEGNALCVIPPDNRFLAGCGRLGELNGEGTRELGVFWSAVLGWPLVWDQHEETAVQHPVGGTKVSWSGPPVPPVVGRVPQRLALTTDDLDADVARLIARGAARGGEDDAGTVRLIDPDGQEFWLRAAT